MEALNVLDKMTSAIERVLKVATPLATSERMTPDTLLSYAIAQIEKAAKETPEKAKERLRALGQTVDAAKQSFVDTESESIEVQVFAEETTAASDDSEMETSPLAAEAAIGNSAFATNAEDLHKALARLGKELGDLRDGSSATLPADATVQTGAEVAWPVDMNTTEFRDGVRKAADAPAWGDDPKGLRAGGQ